MFVLSNSATFLNLNPTICYGDTVYVGGNAYYQTGVYTNVLTNSVGCDSVISLDLRVVSPTNLVYDICPGDSIQVGSNVYYSAGLYVDSLVAANGCDSVINTQINTYSQYNSIYGGILEDKCGKLLKDFFKKVRWITKSIFQNSKYQNLTENLKI